MYCFFQKRWNELICLLGLHLNLKFTHCTATTLEVEIIIFKSPVGSLYLCLFIWIFFWCFFLFWVSFWHCRHCSWLIQRTLFVKEIQFQWIQFQCFVFITFWYKVSFGVKVLNSSWSLGFESSILSTFCN